MDRRIAIAMIIRLKKIIGSDNYVSIKSNISHNSTGEVKWLVQLYIDKFIKGLSNDGDGCLIVSKSNIKELDLYLVNNLTGYKSSYKHK